SWSFSSLWYGSQELAGCHRHCPTPEDRDRRPNAHCGRSLRLSGSGTPHRSRNRYQTQASSDYATAYQITPSLSTPFFSHLARYTAFVNVNPTSGADGL